MMQRLLGAALICAAVVTAAVALAVFGPPTKHLPSPPPRTVGNTTHVTVTLEVTPTRYFVLPVLATLALGIVLLVLPQSKRQPTSSTPSPGE